MCISSFWQVGSVVYASAREALSAARAIKDLTGHTAVVSQFSSQETDWEAVKPAPARSQSIAPPTAPHK